MSEKKGKTLVVVESPAKAKTINKILGNDYKVTASVGHIIDLPKSKLGVDIENRFEPEYTVIKGKGNIIKELATEAQKAGDVLIATDPDREGEAIAYFIANSIKKVNPNISRIEFNEITKPAVLRALKNPRDIDMDRVQAQQARRVLDRIVGYQVSPILWKSIYKGLSAGRVQSVALRLICERETEIEKFQPVEYWSITAQLETPSKEKFSAKLVKIGGKTLSPEKFRIGNKEEATAHYNKLSNARYIVDTIKREQVKKHAPPPFITSTIQQDAARRYGMATSRIMQAAQKLYEGIAIEGKGEVGLITYMRTDSTRISPEALNAARDYIGKAYGNEFLPPKPNVYRSKKNAQDAHEAIRPTYLTADFEPQKLKRFLTSDQFKIYDLIWKRFIACQIKPAIADRMTIDVVAAKDYLFRASGEVILFPGWMAVYQEAAPDDVKLDDDAEQTPENLPKEINEKDVLNLLNLLLKKHLTKPPARYTESSLVKTLDKLGIGRPSTYAAIISTLLQRSYVEKKDRALLPTDLGKTVNKLLVKYFPNIFNVTFTAQMEEELDKIEQHEVSYLEAMQRFYQPFKETLEKVSGNIQSIKQSLQQASDEVCEVCGKPMVIKWGRNGQFLACSGYPECKTTKPLPEELEQTQTDEICDKCGSPMVIKKGKYGEFLACSRYPECKNARPISTGVTCPLDGGEIVQRTSRRGKIFYSCNNYPKCTFALWNKPQAITCSKCNYPLMEEKTTRKDGSFLQCPECKNKQKIATS
jgi:DNA topoisomerase-1